MATEDRRRVKGKKNTRIRKMSRITNRKLLISTLFGARRGAGTSTETVTEPRGCVTARHGGSSCSDSQTSFAQRSRCAAACLLSRKRTTKERGKKNVAAKHQFCDTASPPTRTQRHCHFTTLVNLPWRKMCIFAFLLALTFLLSR